MGVCGSSTAKTGGSGNTAQPSYFKNSTPASASNTTPTSAERRQMMANAVQSRSKSTTPKEKKRAGLYGDLGETEKSGRPKTEWEMENAEALGTAKFDNRG